MQILTISPHQNVGHSNLLKFRPVLSFTQRGFFDSVIIKLINSLRLMLQRLQLKRLYTRPH